MSRNKKVPVRNDLVPGLMRKFGNSEFSTKATNQELKRIVTSRKNGGKA